MGFFDLFSRTAGPPPSAATALGAAMGVRVSLSVDAKLQQLLEDHPELLAVETRFRVWVVESAMFSLAAPLSRGSASRLEEFFEGFWPRALADLRNDFGDPSAEGRFHAEVEQLVTGALQAYRTLLPEAAVLAIGKQVATYWALPDLRHASVWGALAIEYGHKVAGLMKLYSDQLGDNKVR